MKYSLPINTKRDFFSKAEGCSRFMTFSAVWFAGLHDLWWVCSCASYQIVLFIPQSVLLIVSATQNYLSPGLPISKCVLIHIQPVPGLAHWSTFVRVDLTAWRYTQDGGNSNLVFGDLNLRHLAKVDFSSGVWSSIASDVWTGIAKHSVTFCPLTTAPKYSWPSFCAF